MGDQKQKLPYPKSVFFIVSNEFCERFNYYGMRTILSFYLTDILFYSEPDAKIIYHTFTMLVYFFPIFGAMLADSYLGKFKTILYVSIIYAAGSSVLSMASAPPVPLEAKGFSLLGLLLIAVGTGGIKPCVAAFGGDQFVLPQQVHQLEKYFSLFYFAINAGSFISTALTPILREDVHCFGNDTCYSLAFAVPGLLMVTSIVVFLVGKPFYKIKKPAGNMMVKVGKCISTAITTKAKSRGLVKKSHWLDYAEPRHGPKLVNEVKILLKVLVLYLPLPVFWALFDQQGTGWTFQARRMNGDIGFYTILPDQMQIVNPILILVFIPLFQYCIYPALGKCQLLKTPLQRLVAGGVLAAISFAVSAAISVAIESNDPVMPTAGNGQIRIFNGLNCELNVKASDISKDDINVPALEMYSNIDLVLKGKVSYKYSASSKCSSQVSGSFELNEKTSVAYFFGNDAAATFMLDDITKNEKALPRFRTLIKSDQPVSVDFLDSKGVLKHNSNSTYFELGEIHPDTYTLKIGNFSYKTEFQLGGVYTVVISQINNDNYAVNNIEVTKPNSVHMLFILPQYILITMGEIMFSITGLEFSYSQAPSSMKSVVQACFLLTTAVGNLLVVIIESIRVFERESAMFFLYAALMLIDMGIFALMAMKYKYVEKDEDGQDSIEFPPSPKNGIDNKGYKGNENNL